MTAGKAKTSIPAVVLGATGYVGGEFLRLLALHPVFELRAAVSDSQSGTSIGKWFPHLACAYSEHSFVAHEDWIQQVSEGEDLALFSAAPHGASAGIIKAALEAAASKNINIHVVDASADFRYAAEADFASVYGIAHGAPELLPAFSSGLPEHVTGTPTRHVGHPGCFATAVLLAAVPLLRAKLVDSELFVTGITGSTGSGRVAQAGTHHPERQSNLYAYKALQHRHAPEIVALASAASGAQATLNFVPHSGPFVDLVEGTPRLKNVVASNRCQIGVALEQNAIVVTSAIDNLVKGAAGGAVQWMNRLWDLPETDGLNAPAPGWT